MTQTLFSLTKWNGETSEELTYWYDNLSREDVVATARKLMSADIKLISSTHFEENGERIHECFMNSNTPPDYVWVCSKLSEGYDEWDPMYDINSLGLLTSEYCYIIHGLELYLEELKHSENARIQRRIEADIARIECLRKQLAEHAHIKL